MPPRVVADSNVLISAVYGPGRPADVVDRARRGDFTLYLSRFILDEVQRILTDKLDWDALRVTTALARLRNATTLIDPGRPRLKVVADPTDNRILECAVAARARYLVTGDRGLRRLGKYRRIRVLTPRAFLSLMPLAPTP